CIMAMDTGTSCGSVVIVIPVAGEIVISLGATELLLQAIAAVLAGAVFGDHCLPISDTTVLSATGSASDYIVHVVSQLPYAIVSALIALVGFIVLGYTESVVIALLSLLVCILIVYLIVKFIYRPVPNKSA